MYHIFVYWILLVGGLIFILIQDVKEMFRDYEELQ